MAQERVCVFHLYDLVLMRLNKALYVNSRKKAWRLPVFDLYSKSKSILLYEKYIQREMKTVKRSRQLENFRKILQANSITSFKRGSTITFHLNRILSCRLEPFWKCVFCRQLLYSCGNNVSPNFVWWKNIKHWLCLSSKKFTTKALGVKGNPATMNLAPIYPSKIDP